MSLQKESERGYQARQMLENPLFVEVTNQMQQAIVDKWRSCPMRDREGAHELKIMDKLLADFVGMFKQIAETGKMADIQLEQERKVSKLQRAGIR